MDRAPVLWLREKIHVKEVVGSNSHTGYWMAIFTLICCKNSIVCLKRLKINYKEA